MTASLLATLGLPLPARVPPGQAPAGPKQPTGPIRAPGVEPREELPARSPPAQGKGTSQPPGGTVPSGPAMEPPSVASPSDRNTTILLGFVAIPTRETA